LRHADLPAFQRLMQLGARNGDEVQSILRAFDSNTLIRAMVDTSGNQVLLTSGNNKRGLLHIISRHLTGDIDGSYTSFFSNRLKVGDVTDLIAQTVQNGGRTLQDNGNWLYRWYNETWGWINVVVDENGEVISAFPD
jgi:hypothetical protein